MGVSPFGMGVARIAGSIVDGNVRSYLALASAYGANIGCKRHVAVRMSQLVQALPDEHPDFNGLSGLLDSSSSVTKSVVAYLNSLAELTEAFADNLTHVVKAMGEVAEEE